VQIHFVGIDATSSTTHVALTIMAAGLLARLNQGSLYFLDLALGSHSSSSHDVTAVRSRFIEADGKPFT
jgi:hypothetical protein